jgi:hypothetical protein
VNAVPPPLVEGLTPEARRYAIWELARRAGVRSDEFERWRLEIGGTHTLVFPEPGASACIRFPHYAPDHWRRRDSWQRRTVRYAWMAPARRSLQQLVPDFVVPFADETAHDGTPLFRSSSGGMVESSVDLPAAAFCTLTRIEEVANPSRDRHGRFPSSESVAARDGFLHRPVVDEYGLALEQALQSILPAWQPASSPFRFLLSQDVDHIGIPFSLSKTIGHTVRRHKPSDSLRDFGSWFGGTPAWLRSVSHVAEAAHSRRLSNAAYWKATTRVTEWDTGYDPRDPRVRRVALALRESGVELGVHPGYFTFDDPQALHDEITILRQVLGDGPLGGRQHFLRWSPTTWEHWEQCGLAYDSSVGYSDRVGFRAGTCHPYRPWLLARNRPARLVELPLIAMDVALTGTYGADEEQLRSIVSDLVERCSAVGGVMTLLWHNSTHADALTRRTCTYALDLVSSRGEVGEVGRTATLAHA